MTHHYDSLKSDAARERDKTSDQLATHLISGTMGRLRDHRQDHVKSESEEFSLSAETYGAFSFSGRVGTRTTFEMADQVRRPLKVRAVRAANSQAGVSWLTSSRSNDALRKSASGRRDGFGFPSVIR